MSLLEIRNLTIAVAAAGRWIPVVEGLDLTLEPGEVLGLVGESGSGKSMTALAVMGLLPPGARLAADRLRYGDTDLLRATPAQRRRLLGGEMAMVFQDPAAALNPCFTIGFQLEEVLRFHLGLPRAERRRRAIDLLARTGLDRPEQRLAQFPHQLSGGMNQRALIAIAIAAEPRLLIADEPTAALDGTIQAQILALLAELQRERQMAMLLISHDIALVAAAATRIQVVYAGQTMEESAAERLVAAPRHPYSAALLAALPERAPYRRLQPIPGTIPPSGAHPPGCVFHPRCAFAFARCRAERPVYAQGVRCHTPLDEAGRPQGHPGPAALLRAAPER